MRKQMDGLAALVRQSLSQDPHSGDLFVFRNRRGDLVEILFFDQQGYCLFAKRLERRTFPLTLPENASYYTVTATQLGELLRGVPICVK